MLLLDSISRRQAPDCFAHLSNVSSAPSAGPMSTSTHRIEKRRHAQHPRGRTVIKKERKSHFWELLCAYVHQSVLMSDHLCWIPHRVKLSGRARMSAETFQVHISPKIECTAFRDRWPSIARGFLVEVCWRPWLGNWAQWIAISFSKQMILEFYDQVLP